MHLDLTGRAALVTGASSPIGAAIASALADAGARVLAHHRSGPPPPGAAATAAADLTADGAVERLVASAVADLGRLDVVVHNAAAQDLAGFLDRDDDGWRAMWELNLLAAHRLTRAAATAMATSQVDGATRGSIIHIASIEATTPAPDHAAYAVSKAALVMHARAAALELGPRGIRVNSVSPGLVDRPGLAADWPDGVTRYRAAAALGRLVDPEDVAAACTFLASDAAAAITGIDLVVDAGVSVHPHF